MIYLNINELKHTFNRYALVLPDCLQFMYKVECHNIIGKADVRAEKHIWRALLIYYYKYIIIKILLWEKYV